MLHWGGQRNTNLENLTFDRLVTRWTRGWMTQPRQVRLQHSKDASALRRRGAYTHHVMGKTVDLNSREC